jgi:hypothetical protein
MATSTKKKPLVLYPGMSSSNLKAFGSLYPTYAINSEVTDNVLIRVVNKILSLFELEPLTSDNITNPFIFMSNVLYERILKTDKKEIIIPTTDTKLTSEDLKPRKMGVIPKKIFEFFISIFKDTYLQIAEEDKKVYNSLKKIIDGNYLIYIRYPDEVDSVSEIKGFDKIYYDSYKLKSKKGVRSIRKEKIIHNAIVSAALELDKDEDEHEDEDITTTEVYPGETFVNTIKEDLQIIIEEGGELKKDTLDITPEYLTRAYKTERGSLLSRYPDMILPIEPDEGIIKASELFGKLANKTYKIPKQADLEIIRKDLEEIVPQRARKGALKIPSKLYFGKSKRKNIYSASSYLYVKKTKKTGGHSLILV